MCLVTNIEGSSSMLQVNIESSKMSADNSETEEHEDEHKQKIKRVSLHQNPVPIVP